jgi:putative endonuclease
MSRTYYVYILASKSRRLYIGVTNNLERRMWEHKNKVVEGFTKQYNIDRLIYFEDITDVRSTIEREKQLKGWRREKKITLIETTNAAWEDLSVRLQLVDVTHSEMKTPASAGVLEHNGL